MSDNLAIEPSLFFQSSGDNSTDNPSEPVEEVAEALEEVPEEIEAEDSADESEEIESEESEELLVYEVDGQEFDENEIKEMKKAFDNAKSMQADYTRKTQALAENVRTEANKLVAPEIEALKNVVAELESVIATENEVDMDELREVDTSEYIRVKELKEKREKLKKEALSKLNGKAETKSPEEIKTENEKLVKANSHWVDEKGQATPEYKADMELLTAYLETNDWDQGKFSKIHDANILNAVIKAAKYDELKQKTKAVKKKVKAVVKSKKNTGTVKNKPEKTQTFSDKFYG